MGHSSPNSGVSLSEADAKEYGITRLFNRDMNRLEWTVACSCGECESRPFAANVSAAYMVRKFKQHGWAVVEKRQPVCPRCREAERKIRTIREEPMPTIGPDLKLTRNIMRMLDEHFDTEVHRYRGNASDSFVANVVGCSADMVAHIRVDAGFGELADDPALTEIKSELDTLKDAVRGEVEGLREETRSLISSVTDKFKNEMLAIRHKCDQDIAEALNLFNEKHAELTARLDPSRKAS